jgi:hypothetical protein
MRSVITEAKKLLAGEPFHPDYRLFKSTCVAVDGTHNDTWFFRERFLFWWKIHKEPTPPDGDKFPLHFDDEASAKRWLAKQLLSRKVEEVEV